MASEPLAVSSVLTAIVLPPEATSAPPIAIEHAPCVPQIGLPDRSSRRFVPC